MQHRIVYVTGFNLIGPFALKVFFDDGTTQDVDLTEMLHGELYGPLRDPEFFKLVRIDVDAKTLVWPNGADFDPATLYDWPKLKDAMIAKAQKWAVK